MTEVTRCRVCSKPVSLRGDWGTVKPHRNGGAECEGSQQAPAGDPPCTVGCREVGRVSWPPDLSGAPMASTVVCERPEHQREAAEWVRSKTGREGVFVALKGAVTDA
jgi:hypothetical protein